MSVHRLPDRAAGLVLPEPEAVDSLDAEGLIEVATQLGALLTRVQARLALRGAGFGNTPGHRGAGDRLLDTGAVAAKIGKSRSWVEKHPDALPPRRRVGGEALWSERDLDTWIKTRPLWED